MRCLSRLFAVALALGACRTAAKAEPAPAPSQPGFSELYAKPGLVPTLGEERARWIVATSGELARSLRAMHGVVDARVHLAVQATSLDAFGARREPARASVLVTRRAGLPPLDEHAVRALVSGALDGLAPEAIAIVQDEASPERREPLVRVGPLRVAAASAGTLKLLLGAALVLDALLALLLVAVVARRRRAERAAA